MNSFLPTQFETNQSPPDIIYGYVSVKSKGGTSIFDVKKPPKCSKPFHAKKKHMNQALKSLEYIGFEIMVQSRLGVAIAGPADAYRELTGGRVKTVERLVSTPEERYKYVTNLDIVGKKQPKVFGWGNIQSTSTKIEGVLLDSPAVFDASPSDVLEDLPQHYLNVPGDVAEGLQAHKLHQNGIKGEGVTVAMLDTGFYNHSFFDPYNVLPPQTTVPGFDGDKDPVGHGTGIAANLFAVAPEAMLQPIRIADNWGDWAGGLSGLILARRMGHPIITNSWGVPVQGRPSSPAGLEERYPLLAEIRRSIERNIFVIFSAGNGTYKLEPQVPKVFAAGGVYLSPKGHLWASDFASGYARDQLIYQGSAVPDACGLCGMQPRAKYILLPTQPGSEYDKLMSLPKLDSLNPDPTGDGTTPNDGWVMFSGTSSAAPQIAGVAALILSVVPDLIPDQITEAIIKTATDVTRGHCSFGNRAKERFDRATGHGLVNAAAAVRYAQDKFAA